MSTHESPIFGAPGQHTERLSGSLEDDNPLLQHSKYDQLLGDFGPATPYEPPQSEQPAAQSVTEYLAEHPDLHNEEDDTASVNVLALLGDLAAAREASADEPEELMPHSDASAETPEQAAERQHQERWGTVDGPRLHSQAPGLPEDQRNIPRSVRERRGNTSTDRARAYQRDHQARQRRIAQRRGAFGENAFDVDAEEGQGPDVNPNDPKRRP